MKHVFWHGHPTQLCSTVTLGEIGAVFRSLTTTVHVVAMEIATLKGCREVFVLLNGCKEWRNKRGRLGMFYFFCKWRQIAQSCCVFLPESESFSWTHLGLSLPMNVAVLDKFLKKADGCFRVPAFSVQSVHGLWLKTWSPVWQPNPDRLSVPVNNSFVSLTE